VDIDVNDGLYVIAMNLLHAVMEYGTHWLLRENPALQTQPVSLEVPMRDVIGDAHAVHALAPVSE